MTPNKNKNLTWFYKGAIPADPSIFFANVERSFRKTSTKSIGDSPSISTTLTTMREISNTDTS